MNSIENQILKLSKITVANNDYKEVEKELQLIGRRTKTRSKRRSTKRRS